MSPVQVSVSQVRQCRKTKPREMILLPCHPCVCICIHIPMGFICLCVYDCLGMGFSLHLPTCSLFCRLRHRRWARKGKSYPHQLIKSSSFPKTLRLVSEDKVLSSGRLVSLPTSTWINTSWAWAPSVFLQFPVRTQCGGWIESSRWKGCYSAWVFEGLCQGFLAAALCDWVQVCWGCGWWIWLPMSPWSLVKSPLFHLRQKEDLPCLEVGALKDPAW